MSRKDAQMRLAVLWVAAAILGAVVLFVQTSVAGIFEESESAEIWNWFTEAVLPTTTLMFGVVGAAAWAGSNRPVPKRLYQLAFFTSAVYLSAVVAVIVLVAVNFSMTPLTASRRPLQFFYAVANIFIGIFFVGGSSDDRAPAGAVRDAGPASPARAPEHR